MATPVESIVESTSESALRSCGEGPEERLSVDDVCAVRQADGMEELDRRLAALCRERGPLRAALARIAFRLTWARAWERIGYARLSDYAVERLGMSARSVLSLAHVGGKLSHLPLLEEALVEGTLGWTKVRLLANLPPGEDEARWIARATRVTAEQLSKEVRRVDRGSVEAGALDELNGRSRFFEVLCTPEVRRKWGAMRGAASRAAGRLLHISEAAELVAAEVLSATPIDQPVDEEEEACEEAGASWSRESEPAEETAELSGTASASRESAAEGTAKAVRPHWPGEGALKPLLEGLREADAFELDDRFRRALSMEQRLDARTGPLLALLWRSWVHRELGYTTREAYARERLGMDPTRTRTLVRLERATVLSESFARAYRTGALSWVKAGVLVPLVTSDSLGRFVDDWVAWAGRVTVRRLREDVEWALTLQETDPEAYWQGAGLPPELREARERRNAETERGAGTDREIGAPRRNREGGLQPAGRGGSEATSEHDGGADREIRAPHREREGHIAEVQPGIGAVASGDPGTDREIGALPGKRRGHVAHDETCSVRFIGPADIVQLFKAVVCTVRRSLERDTGRLPTPGEAVGVMLDHAFSSWDSPNGKVAARHKVFARDGWRCATPGCSSMQNLHDHHIRFRSAGGSDELENRVTLCAFHHLRGVHAELLRCVGRAPDGITWQLGIRPGVTPLLAYRSGDLRIPAMQA